MLEETEKISRVRLDAAENSLQAISEECKQVRMSRCQAVKTVRLNGHSRLRLSIWNLFIFLWFICLFVYFLWCANLKLDRVGFLRCWRETVDNILLLDVDCGNSSCILNFAVLHDTHASDRIGFHVNRWVTCITHGLQFLFVHWLTCNSTIHATCPTFTAIMQYNPKMTGAVCSCLFIWINSNCVSLI